MTAPTPAVLTVMTAEEIEEISRFMSSAVTRKAFSGLFDTIDAQAAEIAEAEEYIAKLRTSLLHYFGTTDPDELVYVWERHAQTREKALRAARAELVAPPQRRTPGAQRGSHGPSRDDTMSPQNDMPDSEKPGWKEVTCGCCVGGTRWNYNIDGPDDCFCNAGVYYEHAESGVIAMYPGGPLLGRLPKSMRATSTPNVSSRPPEAP